MYRFLATCSDEPLVSTVLALAAEERTVGLAKAVGTEEWVGVMVGVLCSTGSAGTWCRSGCSSDALSLFASRFFSLA